MKRVLVAAIGLGLFAGACNPGELIAEKVAQEVAEEVVEQAMKQDGQEGSAEVDLSEGKINVKTDDGKTAVSVGNDAKIPDSFPKDVWVPEGAKVMMAMELPNGHAVTMHVKGMTVNELNAKYVSWGADKKWEKKSAMDMGANKMLVFQQGETTTTVVISDTQNEELGTRVQLNVATKKKK